MTQQGIVPEDYVRYQFAYLKLGAQVPTPETMVRPSALQLFEDGRTRLRQELRLTFTIGLRSIQRQVDQLLSYSPTLGQEVAFLHVLESIETNGSALLRHCFARKMLAEHTLTYAADFKAVAETYRNAALYQYIAAPAIYDEMWTHLLPAGWGDEALEWWGESFQSWKAAKSSPLGRKLRS